MQYTKSRQAHKGILIAINSSTRAAIDLASIMVGIIVIAIIGGVIAATVFAVIPWAQDNAAKSSIDSVATAESAYRGFTAEDDGQGSFADKTTLVSYQPPNGKVGLLEDSPDLLVEQANDGDDKPCWAAAARSGSGTIWYGTSASNEKFTVEADVTSICPVAFPDFPNGGPGDNTDMPLPDGAALLDVNVYSAWVDSATYLISGYGVPETTVIDGFGGGTYWSPAEGDTIEISYFDKDTQNYVQFYSGPQNTVGDAEIGTLNVASVQLNEETGQLFGFFGTMDENREDDADYAKLSTDGGLMTFVSIETGAEVTIVWEPSTGSGPETTPTWPPVDNPGGGGNTQEACLFWGAVDTSSNGATLISSTRDYVEAATWLQISTNGGGDWTKLTAAGNRDWTDYKISANGQTIVATAYVNFINEWGNNDSGPGRSVFISHNSGQSFTEVDAPSEMEYVGTAAVSSNGQTILLTGYGSIYPRHYGYAVISNDGGQSWESTQQLLSVGWNSGGAGYFASTSVSPDGSHMAVATSSGNFWTYEGGNWTNQSSNGLSAWNYSKWTSSNQLMVDRPFDEGVAIYANDAFTPYPNYDMEAVNQHYGLAGIASMNIASDGSAIYAVQQGQNTQGMWKLDLSTGTWISVNTDITFGYGGMAVPNGGSTVILNFWNDNATHVMISNNSGATWNDATPQGPCTNHQPIEIG